MLDTIKNVAAAVLLTITALFFVALLATVARAETCLSKAEARAKWPKAHLYWHTGDHCWDNKQSTKHEKKRDPRVAPEPLPKVAAQALAAEMKKPQARQQEIIYPPLVASQAAITADVMAVQRPITEWPLMLDLDATGPDPNRGIDGCCWPPLESLK